MMMVVKLPFDLRGVMRTVGFAKNGRVGGEVAEGFRRLPAAFGTVADLAAVNAFWSVKAALFGIDGGQIALNDAGTQEKKKDQPDSFAERNRCVQPLKSIKWKKGHFTSSAFEWRHSFRGSRRGYSSSDLRSRSISISIMSAGFLLLKSTS